MNTQTAIASPTKFLTILLAGEAYGIDVLKVREITRLQPIVPIPRMPPHVRGVINLRGRVIPVTDLRIRFDLAPAVTERTCIVFVRVQLKDRSDLPMGLIVDGVEDVAAILPEEIEPMPDLGNSIDSRYLIGLAKVRGQVKALLDIDRVLGEDSVPDLSNV